MIELNPSFTSMSANFDVEAQNLQKEIMKWVSIWYATGRDFNTAHPVDLPDLVHLLEAIGFYVRRSDVTGGIAPVENGQQGIRISITCNHSNIRCILERPLSEDDCKCKNAEFTLQVPSADEKISEILPPVSDTLSQALGFSINVLIHLMNEFETLVATLPATDDGIKNIKNPLIAKLHLLLGSILHTPVDLPRKQSNLTRRCRSLDSVCSIKLPAHNHPRRERLHNNSSKDASRKIFPKPIIQVVTNLMTEAVETLQAAMSIVQQVPSSARSSS